MPHFKRIFSTLHARTIGRFESSQATTLITHQTHFVHKRLVVNADLLISAARPQLNIRELSTTLRDEIMSKSCLN